MGEFDYNKEYNSWKWDIPKKYNIGYDIVDKHADSKNRNKVALYWEDADGESDRFTFGDMKNLSNKFGNTLKKLGFKKGDRFLIRLPNIPEYHISFIGGVKIGAVPIPSSVMFRAHEIEYRVNDSGAKAVITTPRYIKEVNEIKVYAGRFDPKRWFELLEKYEVTILTSVPTAYRMFLTVKDAEKKYDLSKLRHCISAGEPLNPEIIKKWKNRFGLDVYDGIGMTEIMVYLSNFKGMKIKLGSCGKPQPGHICTIVDHDGKPVPKGEPGVVAIKKTDPGLFKEYWNKPKKTSESFKNGWFLSGDVLYQDEEDYYWFSGRDDDLIMASGYRISPFEVESAVISHPEVLECAVVASPDKMRGVIVKAFVILHDMKKASDKLIEDIQEHTKMVAAPYKYPREIEFVEELPKTQSGKIKRKELRELEMKKKGVSK